HHFPGNRNRVNDVFQKSHRTAIAFFIHNAGVSVTWPSRSGYPPSPTVVLEGSASATWTPCSTASSALPFLSNTFQAASLASIPNFQVEMTRGLLTARGTSCLRGPPAA